MFCCVHGLANIQDLEDGLVPNAHHLKHLPAPALGVSGKKSIEAELQKDFP